MPKKQVKMSYNMSNTRIERHEGKVSNLKVSVSTKSEQKNLLLFASPVPKDLATNPMKERKFPGNTTGRFGVRLHRPEE